MSSDLASLLQDFCCCGNNTCCYCSFASKARALQDEVDRLQAAHARVERSDAGQLLSRMTELEAELAAERVINGRLDDEIKRLRAVGDALVDAVERQQWSTVDVAVAAWQEARREQ